MMTRLSQKYTHLHHSLFIIIYFFCYFTCLFSLSSCTLLQKNLRRDTSNIKAIHLPEKIPDLHDKGNFLAEMEWHLGSDDVSSEEANMPHILSNTVKQTPAGRMFGMRGVSEFSRPNSNIVNSKNDEQQMNDEGVPSANDRFSAKIVDIYSRELDPNDQSAKPLLKQYKHYLSTNAEYVDTLKKLFTDMDENGDGSIDDSELDSAISKGHLTSVGARAIKTWDINYTRRISWEEFSMGPFFLVLLDTNEKLLDDFMHQTSGYADKCAKYYLSMMNAYERENPAAFGLVEESSTVRARGRAQAGHKQIFKKLMGAAKSMFGFGKGKEVKEDPRPKSQFGIPSYLDEECVMCQYVVQRVEHEMERKVVDDFTAFDNIPRSSDQAPNPNTWGAIRSGDKGRRDREQLHEVKRQRSPARMMKELTETIMKMICGDDVPKLYKKTCKEIWNIRGQLAYGLVRKRSAAYNCQTAKMCASGSYFYFDTVVHAPIKSERFNGLRGMCGLLGGPNERKVGVSKTMCVLQGLGRSTGILK